MCISMYIYIKCILYNIYIYMCTWVEFLLGCCIDEALAHELIDGTFDETLHLDPCSCTWTLKSVLGVKIRTVSLTSKGKPILSRPAPPEEGQRTRQSAQANHEQGRGPFELACGPCTGCAEEQAPANERAVPKSNDQENTWELHVDMSHGGIQRHA